MKPCYLSVIILVSSKNNVMLALTNDSIILQGTEVKLVGS